MTSHLFSSLKYLIKHWRIVVVLSGVSIYLKHLNLICRQVRNSVSKVMNTHDVSTQYYLTPSGLPILFYFVLIYLIFLLVSSPHPWGKSVMTHSTWKTPPLVKLLFFSFSSSTSRNMGLSKEKSNVKDTPFPFVVVDRLLQRTFILQIFVISESGEKKGSLKKRFTIFCLEVWLCTFVR